MHSYALGRVSPNALLFGLTNQRSLKKDLKKKKHVGGENAPKLYSISPE